MWLKDLHGARMLDQSHVAFAYHAESSIKICHICVCVSSKLPYEGLWNIEDDHAPTLQYDSAINTSYQAVWVDCTVSHATTSISPGLELEPICDQCRPWQFASRLSSLHDRLPHAVAPYPFPRCRERPGASRTYRCACRKPPGIMSSPSMLLIAVTIPLSICDRPSLLPL